MPDDNRERRPIRGSKIEYKLFDEDFKWDGVVKKVGKAKSKNKDICWIERTEGNKKHEMPVNFMRYVKKWSYLTKPIDNFQDERFNNETNKSKSSSQKEDDSLGV